LVLSNNSYNKVTDDIIVVAITSNIGAKFSEIRLSKDDTRDGELKVESSIRVDKIYTISQNIAIKKLVAVKPNKVIEVRNKLMELIK
jgi:mRNA interferase MazF